MNKCGITSGSEVRSEERRVTSIQLMCLKAANLPALATHTALAATPPKKQEGVSFTSFVLVFSVGLRAC